MQTEIERLRLVERQRTHPGVWKRTRRLSRNYPVVPIVILTLLAITAIFAPLLAPHDPEFGVLTKRNVPPPWLDGGSSEHLLGTDNLGRDLFSRVLFGSRISLMVAAIVLTAGAVGGTLLGMISGWAGGTMDEVLMRFVDFTLAIPFILVALVVVTVFGQSIEIVIILLVVFSWNGFARQVRAETMQLKTLDYVAQAQVVGASTARIMLKHLLPGVVNTVLVLSTLRVGTLILTESVLSYLGVGIPPPTPAWGLMVAEGRNYITLAWWITVFPGLAIFLTVLAFNFLGDWMRDHFDPMLRQQV